GALIPRKGHDIIIAAVARLADVTLLIAGHGAERARLMRLADALGARDRVRLTGEVPHERMPRLLAAGDVMALASEREGLANVWVEALACGTPVVTTDVDGAREAIDRPAAGVLVTERSPEAFARAIAAVLNDPPSPMAVRDGASRFGWEKNTE